MVYDSFFSPNTMNVKPGTTIKWVWAAGNSYTHDVMLDKAPTGVKHFMSDYAAGSYSFKRLLSKPGTYKFKCDLHEGMAMKVVVRRR